MITETSTDRSQNDPALPHLPPRATFRGLTPVRARLAAVIFAGLALACSSSSITAPEATVTPAGSVRHDMGLVSPTDLLEPFPVLGATSSKESDDEAKLNPDYLVATETTFPVTEVVHNVCRNEDPVLNGFMKVRERLKMDDLTLQYRQDIWKDTRGVFATAQAYEDDDYDESTPKRLVTVRYRNKETALDKFTVGPAGLPFESVQEQRIWLERMGWEGYYDRYQKQPGDDMFVFVRERVRTDRNGNTKVERTFRTECK